MENNTEELTKKQQLANRYILAVNDMDEVIANLQCYHLMSQISDADGQSNWATARRALMSTAIVAYCRPFTENKSIGFASEKLPIRDLKAVRLRRNLHDLLLKKRNTFIAHADWSARATEMQLIDDSTLNVTFTVPEFWEGLDLKEFMILAGGVRMECIGRAFEQAPPPARLAGGE